jgi:hypothetical protein
MCEASGSRDPDGPGGKSNPGCRADPFVNRFFLQKPVRLHPADEPRAHQQILSSIEATVPPVCNCEHCITFVIHTLRTANVSQKKKTL